MRGVHHILSLAAPVVLGHIRNDQRGIPPIRTRWPGVELILLAAIVTDPIWFGNDTAAEPQAITIDMDPVILETQCASRFREDILRMTVEEGDHAPSGIQSQSSELRKRRQCGVLR